MVWTVVGLIVFWVWFLIGFVLWLPDEKGCCGLEAKYAWLWPIFKFLETKDDCPVLHRRSSKMDICSIVSSPPARPALQDGGR